MPNAIEHAQVLLDWVRRQWRIEMKTSVQSYFRVPQAEEEASTNKQNSPEIFLRMEYKITARARDCFYFAQRRRQRRRRRKQWYIANLKVERGCRMIAE